MTTTDWVMALADVVLICAIAFWTSVAFSVLLPCISRIFLRSVK